MTFEQMGERFIASHEAGWKNPKHRQQWRNTLKSYVYRASAHCRCRKSTPPWRWRVQQILEHGLAARPETASRVRGRCEQIWDAAKAQKLCSGENPFDWKTLKHLLPAKTKIHKVKHHAAVPHREIPALMEKLRARSSVSARALEFAILCASRANEVMLARGCEFDLANARWNIPGEPHEGNRPHTVMLSKRAVEIVRELHPSGLKPDELVFRCHRRRADEDAGVGWLRRCDSPRHRASKLQNMVRQMHRLQGCNFGSVPCPHRRRQSQSCVCPRGIRATTRRVDGSVVTALRFATDRRQFCSFARMIISNLRRLGRRAEHAFPQCAAAATLQMRMRQRRRNGATTSEPDSNY